MNKRGEKLMVFWWFLAVMLVTVLIVSTAIGFFTKPVDVRGLQTEIVYSNLYDCLVSGSYLNSDVFEKDFDLSKFCGFRNQEEMSGLRFFIYLDIVDKDSAKSLLIKPFRLGEGSLYADCEISEVYKMKYSPNCLNRTDVIPIYYFSKDERKVAFFNVVVASQYQGERIPILDLSNGGEK